MNQSSGSKPLLIVLSGPTAVGKTSLSIQLSTRLDAEIISADSRQVYKEMNIGTAKPNKEELDQVPHHFIDHISIDEPYSAGKYEQEVLDFLLKYFQKKPIALIVGGTGFYIQAVIKGLDSFPKITPKVKQGVEQDLEEKGLKYLQDELKNIDPDSYEDLDIQNPRRVVRAIQVYRESGTPFSNFKKMQLVQHNFNTVKILLERDRQQLYKRINQRVDRMIEKGLEEEARKLYPKSGLPSLQTVGYKEWFDHFEGKIDRETAISKIKQHTRNYAKRQLTWFRNKEDWVRFPADDQEKIISYLINHPRVKSARVHSREVDQ